MLEAYLEGLETGYFEIGEAFKGLKDENVWKRPAEGLLSIGELAGHIAYWEASRLAGEGGVPVSDANGISMVPDMTKCHVKSLLIDARFGYHISTLENTPSEEHLAMTADQVYTELVRVHEESVELFKALNPDLESQVPGWSEGWTYGGFLKYLVFHVAYHTGQIYSVRHLLGEETPDN